MAIALVWLKRDLRLSDHQPLLEAAASGLPVLLLYCFEPEQIQDPHYSARHWRFIRQALQDLQRRLPVGSLYVIKQDVLTTLAQLQQQFGIAQLFSHQEVGLHSTFVRDKAVQAWCDQQGISWRQAPYAAVVRGLAQREGWDKYWQQVMAAPLANVDLAKVNWSTQAAALANFKCVTDYPVARDHAFQEGGETAAWQSVQSFFAERGRDYAYSISSPALSQLHCSRWSAYLAWGNLSVRQVYQQLVAHWQQHSQLQPFDKKWRRSLEALNARLHWHCHFIQKFESQSDMEFQPVNSGYQALPRVSGELAATRLLAWQQGNTGIPMVDACMRSLQHSGYLNFRMRAMLVSFLCHHLELDWRCGVQHLARLFLDFEPGIHYAQFQMQAGVTGINTIRIYSPAKQGLEQDTDGHFVKRWLPELANIPAPLVHTPWLLSPMECLMYNFELGVDYPEPIVDLKHSYGQAQALLWGWRDKPEVKRENARLLKRHGRLAGEGKA